MTQTGQVALADASGEGVRSCSRKRFDAGDRRTAPPGPRPPTPADAAASTTVPELVVTAGEARGGDQSGADVDRRRWR